jgi:hypothetical protein
MPSLFKACYMFLHKKVSTGNLNERKKIKKFKEELIAYFPLIQHGPYRKRLAQQFFNFCVYLLPQERVYRAVA